MQITSDVLARILSVYGVREGASKREQLQAARIMFDHKIAATLLSAWEAEGELLDPPLELEVEARRRRAAEYLQVWDELAAAYSDIYSLKGHEVARLYPQPLVREVGDIDIVAQSQNVLWKIVATLLGEEWRIDTLTFLKQDETIHAAIELQERGAVSRLTIPKRSIGLMSYAFPGNFRGMPIRTLKAEFRTAKIKNVIALLHERVEHQAELGQFVSRDILDVAVLLYGYSEELWKLLFSAIDEFDLWPEWAEMVNLLRRARLAPDEAEPPSPIQVRRSRSRRARRVLARAWDPATAALAVSQGRFLTVQNSEIWTPRKLAKAHDRVLRYFQAPTRLHQALGAGLPVFAASWVDREPSPDVVIEAQGRLLLARTPVGTLALTAGSPITPES